MSSYARAVLSSTDDYLNTTQFLGKLDEGIHLCALGQQSSGELQKLFEFPPEGNRILIFTDKNIYATPASGKSHNYYHYVLKLSIFCKIYLGPNVHISRSRNPKPSIVDTELRTDKTHPFASHWKKFCIAYDRSPLLFRLYGMSTIENSDLIYNVMNSSIALEGLLLQGDKQENAYKFRIRGAFLLSSTPSGRKKYYEILRHAYNLRSSIVHANDKEKRKIRTAISTELGMNMHRFNEKLVSINRILLKRHIDDPGYFEDLDSMILGK